MTRLPLRSALGHVLAVLALSPLPWIFPAFVLWFASIGIGVSLLGLGLTTASLMGHRASRRVLIVFLFVMVFPVLRLLFADDFVPGIFLFWPAICVAAAVLLWIDLRKTPPPPSA